MAKYRLIGFSNPMDGREEEFNEWYSNTHVPDILKVPGFESASRFRLNPSSQADAAMPWRYVVIYEIDTSDINATMSALTTAATCGLLTMSDSLDAASMRSLVIEQIGQTVGGPNESR